MLQTVAFVWWLATLNATVAGLVSANMELKTRLEGINSTVITPAIQTASRLDVVIAKIEAQEKQINSISMEVQTLRLEIGKTGRR